MVRISVDVSLGTFVKLEERTARENVNKAELIRGFIGGWLAEGEGKSDE